MTGIADCCARVASGHAAVAPPSSVMKSRRLMGARALVRGPHATRSKRCCAPQQIRSADVRTGSKRESTRCWLESAFTSSGMPLRRLSPESCHKVVEKTSYHPLLYDMAEAKAMDRGARSNETAPRCCHSGVVRNGRSFCLRWSARRLWFARYEEYQPTASRGPLDICIRRALRFCTSNGSARGRCLQPRCGSRFCPGRACLRARGSPRNRCGDRRERIACCTIGADHHGERVPPSSSRKGGRELHRNF